MNTQKSILSILIVVLLLTPLTPFSSADDWTITTNETIHGKTLVLSKNIVIENGARLVIKNSTIIFNSTGDYGINVNGGYLYIYNSTIKSDGDSGFHFYVNESSVLEMENSSITHARTSLYPLLVYGSIVLTKARANIKNCVFSHSGYITISHSNVTVSKCYFYNSSMGIKTYNSNVEINECHFVLPLHGGSVSIDTIRGYGGHLTISNCYITNNVQHIAGNTICLAKMDAEINDCYIIQYAQHLDEESASIYLGQGNYSISNTRIRYSHSESSTYDLTSLYCYGIHAKEAELNVQSSTITGARYGIYAEDSTLNMDKTTISNNSYGIYSSSSNISVERCNLVNNSHGVKIEDNQYTSIKYCNIYGNYIGVMKDCDAIADLRYNYWGSSSGPYVKRGETCVHDGEGDKIYIIRGNIMYEPWVTEKIANTSNFSTPSTPIKLPLLTIFGSVSPRVAPGRQSMEKIFLENDGEADAVFLLAVLSPFYVKVNKIEGGNVIASLPEVKMVSVYLKEKAHTYLTIYFTVPPDVAFGDNASLKFNSTYLPCIVAEFANLPVKTWNVLKKKYNNVDELLNEAWNVSKERENNFFKNFTKLDYEEQLDKLLELYKANSILADYIAWSVIYDTFDEKMNEEKKEGEAKASFFIMPANAIGDITGDIPKGAWGKTKWYVKEFFNRDFFPTAWEGLKGLGAGALHAATFGLVDIKAKNDYMKAGKVIGEIAGNVEMLLLSGAVGEVMSSKTGVQSLQFFSKMEGTPYRTLLGLEARYSNGVYGNIIKLADNPKFGGWYLGIGHHTEKVIELAEEGKLIYPGWFHYYFVTSKVSTWIPKAATYTEFTLYSTTWDTARFAAASIIGGSLIGKGASEFKMVRSIDPNCMEAMPEKFVRNGSETITYTVHFENLANATSPAYDIRVEIPISENLNKSSIKLVSSSHIEKLKYFNVSDSKIEAVFKNINLPPNKNPPDGEGWISFSARPKEGIKSGDEIREKARVYFDYNPPLETNEVVLIFDDKAPSSMAQAELKDGKIRVKINASDEGSGVNSINVLLLKKGSNKAVQAVLNSGDSVSFRVDDGSTYYIYSSAIDNAGNAEYKEKPDAIINTPSSLLPFITMAIAAMAIVIIIVIINKKKRK